MFWWIFPKKYWPKIGLQFTKLSYNVFGAYPQMVQNGFYNNNMSQKWLDILCMYLLDLTSKYLLNLTSKYTPSPPIVIIWQTPPPLELTYWTWPVCTYWTWPGTIVIICHHLANTTPLEQWHHFLMAPKAHSAQPGNLPNFHIMFLMQSLTYLTFLNDLLRELLNSTEPFLVT